MRRRRKLASQIPSILAILAMIMAITAAGCAPPGGGGTNPTPTPAQAAPDATPTPQGGRPDY